MRNLRRFISATLASVPPAIKNLRSTAIQAVVLLVGSNIHVFLHMLLTKAKASENHSLATLFLESVRALYTPSDAFIYVMAFLVPALYVFADSTRLVPRWHWLIIVAGALVVFFTGCVYAVSRFDPLLNAEFLVGFAKLSMGIGLLVWVASLVVENNQRNPIIPHKESGRAILDELKADT